MSAPETTPVALVTGGAIRVGKAIVEALVHAGYRVWVHYNRSVEPAEQLAGELGSACLGIVPAQLAEEVARNELVAAVSDASGPAGGRLDLLVNSAASFEYGGFETRSDEDLRRVLEVNLVAPISLVRGLAPTLRRTRGSVVNILDLAAFFPWNNYLDHCTAKAGLWMATRALASELAPDVRVNGISPGTVLWPTGDKFGPGSKARERIVKAIPLERVGTPQDVAEAVLFLARSNFITGQEISIDGGRKIYSPHEFS